MIGFGFVTFADPSVIETIACREHFLDGKRVLINPIFSKLNDYNQRLTLNQLQSLKRRVKMKKYLWVEFMQMYLKVN